jgi:copper oxidase (laccase) domain-containing protein
VDESDARFFTTAEANGHCRFDLTGYAVQRLMRAGVGAIDRLDVCTYGADGDFFSFRRTTHKAETDYGRQVSAIVLKP